MGPGGVENRPVGAKLGDLSRALRLSELTQVADGNGNGLDRPGNGVRVPPRSESVLRVRVLREMRARSP